MSTDPCAVVFLFLRFALSIGAVALVVAGIIHVFAPPPRPKRPKRTTPAFIRRALERREDQRSPHAPRPNRDS